tara:strand:- start:9719 stop:10564 length:846 start_codon:yes stop_codon:yes gene_type:complete
VIPGMHIDPLSDLARCAVHTITTKPWSLREAAESYFREGIRGITVWLDALKGTTSGAARRILDDNGLTIAALCRGGFFPNKEASLRQNSFDENRDTIDIAAEIGAPLVVLVCGADNSQSLEESRKQIREGIEAILPHAEANRVQLGIEPLHPMYADDRSAINTLREANEMAEYFDSEWVGVTVDVYHLWWDPDLRSEIRRCGENGNLFSFHVCDWRTPTEDLLLDRGVMGEGCINIPEIRSWVEEAGFTGFIEVEIFSTRYWAMDQRNYLKRIVAAYKNYV